MEAAYKTNWNQVLEYKEILIQICKAKYLAETDVKIQIIHFFLYIKHNFLALTLESTPP